MTESNPTRAPAQGDAVLYWPPKRPGAPFVPYSHEATVAGVGEELVMLSVRGKNGRYRASAPLAPRTAHPEGGWSWPAVVTATSENEDPDGE